MDRREFIGCVGAFALCQNWHLTSKKPPKTPELALVPPSVTIKELDKSIFDPRSGSMMIFRAPLVECDKPNRNGHLYPRKVVEQMIKDKSSVVGTLGFDDYCKDGKIHYEVASHYVADFKIEDNVLTGRIEIAHTPYGKVLQALIKEGCRMSYRIGGRGTLHKFDNVWVAENFQLEIVAAVNADQAA